MAVDDLNPDDLRAVVSLIAADGGPQAALDVQDLALPGVWVTLAGLAAAQRLRGLTVRVNLWLVAPDNTPSSQLNDLADLFNAVKARVRAHGGLTFDGDAQALPIAHPDGNRTLPALLVPVRFDTTQDT